MSEDGNIGLVCPDCGIEDCSGTPAEEFIGKYVKKRFEDPAGRVERMWVHITRLDGDRLVGTLDNDPVYDVGFVCGDEVTLTLDEVIGVSE